MTRDGGFKKLVRDRAHRAGESYSTARAHMKRRSALADAELVTRCAAPIVSRLHTADPIARQAVIPGLNRDQGSLIAFWILFVHTADGLAGLCRTHPHRMTDPGFWTLLEIGLRDDGALVAIVTRLRAVVKKAIETAPANAEHGWLDLLATDQMNRLEAEFATIMPRSLHRMASHIRAHPDQFVIGRVAER